jgi:hypothetical protein
MGRAVVLALVALMVAAPVAGARIVVGKGIAGARLEMSKGQVRRAVGRPDRVRHASNDLGPYTEYVYRSKRLRVTFFAGNRVTSVTTTSSSERTDTGVGVGSTRHELTTGVPHARCSGGICQVGQSLPGRRVSAFYLNSARTKVVRVLIGFVID